MLNRDDWFDLARNLDWEFSYVKEEEVYPLAISGEPWLPQSAWQDWDEPYKTTYAQYVKTQAKKEDSVAAVKSVVGQLSDFQRMDVSWSNALKLHAATFALAEFAAMIGNLRAGRFARSSAWRNASTFGALDELRHSQIPLSILHELVQIDGQFDWIHQFFHSNNWVAIVGRHLVDELLLASNPIEFAIGTNFVFETGFTNVQFIGLSANAHDVSDKMMEQVLLSIQSDEARHSQIGGPVLAKVVKEDKQYAQYLLDKWFWRSWIFFSVVTGFAMDYLTPVALRKRSFKELMQEWIEDQFCRTIEAYGLAKPWYWPQFLDALDSYHHMVYASAYSYRATVWFDMVAPGPEERLWLSEHYPKYWPHFEPIWERIGERWSEADVGNDFAVHGTSIVGFCNLCQMVLSGGNPLKNSVCSHQHNGEEYIFCSEPCRWIFTQELERYAAHKDVVKRVIAGIAPGNLAAMLKQYFGLDYSMWGKDAFCGDYPWIKRKEKNS
jgi:toluene monooxygenase system protein A